MRRGILWRRDARTDESSDVVGLFAVVFKPDFMFIIFGFIAAEGNQVVQAEGAGVICSQLKRGLRIGTAVARRVECIADVECAARRTADHTDLDIDLASDAL